MFKIIRFKQNGPQRVIKRGLTLEEAQRHTRNPATRGKGWFDGYTKDKNYDRRQNAKARASRRSMYEPVKKNNFMKDFGF